MHLITRKTLRVFWQKYRDSKTALERWSRIIYKKNFESFTQLRNIFPSAYLVNNLTIFNIGGKLLGIQIGYNNKAEERAMAKKNASQKAFDIRTKRKTIKSFKKKRKWRYQRNNINSVIAKRQQNVAKNSRIYRLLKKQGVLLVCT